MKILVITNLYPPHEIGGYEIRCRDVCERLMSYGHEIRILTSDHHVTGRAKVEEPHVSRRLKIHGMYGNPWLPIHKLHAQEQLNHEMLIREIESTRPDAIHVWNMGGISKSLLHRLEQGSIPVIYDVSDHWIARSLNADVWLSWWNKPASTGPAFVRGLLTAIGSKATISRKVPTRAATELQFRHIYFCSAFMRDHTASKGWPVKHASIIHCGIATGQFDVKTDHSDFRKLLWVGRLSEDKDPLTAVRALAAAHRMGMTHLTLDLFGHGDPEYVARVDEEIASANLQSSINRKTASAAEMRQLYAKYDALLFTSDWGEPFALTPLEAMASGLPVITSLDGGQAELAKDGINSLVAAAKQPELYAKRIQELSQSQELRSSISKIALDEARTRFDIDIISRQIESFLLEAVRT